MAILAVILSMLAPAENDSIPCWAGVQVHLSSPAPIQGELMAIEIRSEQPLAQVQAGSGGQSLHFWKGNGLGTTHRALLGVDLQRKPATYPLAISASLPNGERFGCSIPLNVHKGEFVVEKLTVEKQFVDLDPKDLERARRESRRLRRIFHAVTPERLWQGPFQPPLPGVKGSGNFGKRRIFNEQPRSPHSGEDYPAPSGTPIRAPQRGRVVLAENHFFSGNAVVIDHGLGLYTFFGHMSSISVQVGEMVEANQVLGRVGATGRVTGAHLHWTVRLGKSRVNPQDLFKISG